MIPLADSYGSVIGFTARLLDDDPDAPKYINTPQTVTYDKSNHVFGLHLAKETIRKEGFVVVVEGNMDVIGSHQAGVLNVVATAGTAMTEMHLRQLKRFTGDIRLCFDADRAGVAATERVIPLAQKTEVSLRIVTITNAKDPDELARKDVKAWREAIEKAVYAPDWLIQHYQKEVDLKSAAGKKAFTDTLITTIRRLRDPVEQEHYLKLIAELTNTSFEAVKAKMLNQKDVVLTPRKIPKIPVATINRETIEYHRLQDHFLAINLLQPKLRELILDCKKQFFSEGPRREVFEFIEANPDFDGDPKIAAQLQDIADYVKIVTLQFEELYADLPLEDLQEQAESLKHRLIERYVKRQKQALAIAMQSASDQELKKLIETADRLNQLIK
jgi:DNA primase